MRITLAVQKLITIDKKTKEDAYATTADEMKKESSTIKEIYNNHIGQLKKEYSVLFNDTLEP